MLVFISDIHLTDGTSGETINSRAFKKFTHYLEDMAEAAEAKELEVVLLGDIFDVIRSDYWLQSAIRPWSEPGKKDGNGENLEDYTKAIVKRISENQTNKESMQELKKFKETMHARGVSVRFVYIVGNHDWLINRYPETRTEIAEFLGIDNPEEYKDNPFAAEAFWNNYRAFARHGDKYDPFNFDDVRDASSVGDAIVIDLINRFARDVENQIGVAEDPQLISQLREIDNVRPVLDMPLWIDGACRRARSAKTGEKVKEVWNDLVGNFLKIDFVVKHDKSWEIDIVDQLQLALSITKRISFGDIANLLLGKQLKIEKNYSDKAFHEERMQKNEAEFVLYGHTHGHRIQPLDIVSMADRNLQKTYFNTGTWRKIHTRTAYDVESREFTNWHVMTFIAFYLNDERKKKRFEVWNGALG